PAKSPTIARHFATHEGTFSGFFFPSALEIASSNSPKEGWTPSVRLYMPPTSVSLGIIDAISSAQTILFCASALPILKYLPLFIQLIIAPKLPGGFGPAIRGKRRIDKVTLCIRHQLANHSSANILLSAYGVLPAKGLFSAILSPLSK